MSNDSFQLQMQGGYGLVGSLSHRGERKGSGVWVYEGKGMCSWATISEGVQGYELAWLRFLNTNTLSLKGLFFNMRLFVPRDLYNHLVLYTFPWWFAEQKFVSRSSHPVWSPRLLHSSNGLRLGLVELVYIWQKLPRSFTGHEVNR